MDSFSEEAKLVPEFPTSDCYSRLQFNSAVYVKMPYWDKAVNLSNVAEMNAFILPEIKMVSRDLSCLPIDRSLI